MWSNSRYFWTRDIHRVREGAAVLISGCHGDEFHENVLLHQLVAWLLPAGLSFFSTDGSHLVNVMNLRRLNLLPDSNKADPEQLPVSASRHSSKYHFLKNAHKPQNLFKTQAPVKSPPRPPLLHLPQVLQRHNQQDWSHLRHETGPTGSAGNFNPDKTSDTTETTLILRDSAETRPSTELEKVWGQTCYIVL